jgi:hypothetical protein
MEQQIAASYLWQRMNVFVTRSERERAKEGKECVEEA